jgi:diguanylate cyclase (GGDEF)-like protein
VAALGLFVLTIGSFGRQDASVSVWQVVTLALAWVAVLASSLMVREGIVDPPREVPEMKVAPVPVQAPGSGGSVDVIGFARELHATLESDRLRQLIARRLPAILGVRDVWALTRFGGRQQVIVPAVAAGDVVAMLGDEHRQWATFPLKADGQTIGVLGLAPPPGGFGEEEQRLITLVTSLVAQSLATATAFEAMREASLVDALTGCATRAEGTRRMEAELSRSQRSGTSVGVLMLDIDHFKSINDRFGHETGDGALTAVAHTLLTTLRASDVRCRWGGEEFLLVLPDSTIERAQRAAENLRQRIAATTVSAGDQVVHMTASIGVTVSERDETDIQTLITRADTALYQAKRAGRNRISVVLGAAAANARGRQPRPPDFDFLTHRGPSEVPRHSDRDWDGVDRRDGQRRDRRRIPSPGRRATDVPATAAWER